jgi:RNA polymerase sigma-70 factor (ECF subfamily)
MGAHSSWPSTRPSLLVQLRDGAAHEAWKTFVATYTPLLYRYCRQKGLQDADALDVTQEVMAKVRRFEYNPQRGHFRSWLATVARHEMARLYKERDRPGRGVGGDEADAALDQVASPAEDVAWDRLFNAHVLETALERIRPDFGDQEWQAFAAVALRVVESADGKHLEWVTDASPARVAADLQRDVAWVYKVKSLILKRLREEVLYLAEELGVFV